MYPHLESGVSTAQDDSSSTDVELLCTKPVHTKRDIMNNEIIKNVMKEIFSLKICSVMYSGLELTANHVASREFREF